MMTLQISSPLVRVTCNALSVVCATTAFTFSILPNEARARELPAPYENLGACEKEDFIWNELILPTAYAELPPLEGLDIFGFNQTDMKVTVQRISDEMPEGRVKHIHKRGAVAAVKFEADPTSTYTGLFQGANCGLLRAGVAVAPGGLSPVVPGAAIKLFIDGRPSANFPFMPSLDGQGKDYNFFALPFNTSLAEPKNIVLRVLKNIFARASSTPTQLSLNHVSKYTEYGERVQQPSAPEFAEFVPTRAVQFSSAEHDARLDMLTIPAGTVIFEAYVKTTSGTRGQRLGQVVTKTPFVASAWGDDGLFFKHQRLEDKDAE